jgi:hypothetical protein
MFHEDDVRAAGNENRPAIEELIKKSGCAATTRSRCLPMDRASCSRGRALPKGVEPGDFRYRNAGCELSRRTSGILVNDL